MGSLQDAFERALRDAPYRAIAERIAAKLTDQHVNLSAKDVERLASHLQTGSTDNFRLHSWRWWDDREFAVTLIEKDTQEILDKFESLTQDGLCDLIQSSVEEISSLILKTLRKRWKGERRRQTRERSQFETRLLQRWGPGIDRLHMALTVSRELGDTASEALRDHRASPPLLVDCLTRLHARACQTATEVVCLIESGLADGAMARWRTLHEIAAVAFFLRASGDEVAERYIAHQAVESFRAATDYRECSDRLGYEPMPDQEYEDIKRERDRLVAHYGSDFGATYGWAAEVLGKTSPTIRDIELAAGIDHLRAHYRMASHNVHANPKGLFFKLGLLEESDLLLAGRSNVGLADPGHSCAISLTQVTVALCTLEPTLDSLVGLRILGFLTDEVGELLGRAHAELVEDAG